MSATTIDERVVEMRFDNRNFEANVSTTLNTLDKLKQKLNLSSASKGLEEVSKAARRTDLSGVSAAVETITTKFSALEVVGMTALVNITNSALNAGKRIAKALTIDPIKTGFQEYETQINSVQTILANTESKGTTIKDVNKALDELNKYADMTIYNFTQMTKNIGTFTAAGVDLETSVGAIKGIANLAAVSGSTSQQASTAMYQLSQALAAGRVSLMDWNSVVNAGMGGQVFQDALKRTSEVMGTGAEAAIKKYGSFRESLTQGEWLTTEVLTKTLEQFTMAAEKGSKEWETYKKALKSEGYTDKQAEEILKMANTATDAATKVKTFTQLWDVLKEAAQSGWSQSWEIIIGDFEEAKKLLTSISDVMTEVINKSSDSRNNILEGWKKMGGREDMIAGFANIGKGIFKITGTIRDSFADMIPPITAKKLANFTSGFKDLTEKFIMSDENANKLKRTFDGVFSVMDLFRKVLVTVGDGVGYLFTSGTVEGVVGLFLSLTAVIGDVASSLNKGFSTSTISKAIHDVTDIFAGLFEGINSIGDVVDLTGDVIARGLGILFEPIKETFTWLKENVSFGDIFKGIIGGGIFLSVDKFAEVLEKISGLVDKGLLGLLLGTNDKKQFTQVSLFKEVLSSVNESLISFTSGVRIGSLLAIAASISILSGALRDVSGIKFKDVGRSLFAIGAMFTMLNISFKSITKALDMFSGKGAVKVGITMMAMAKAIDILVGSMSEMSNLSVKDIGKGLLGIGGMMAALVLSLKGIGGVGVKITTIFAIGAMADAIKSISGSLVDLGKLSWGEIKKGLAAMGGALAEFTVALGIFSKIGGLGTLFGSMSLVTAVKSLDEIAEGLSNISTLDWDEIGRGLAGMGGALGGIAAITGLLGKLAGFSAILGSVALVEACRSLGDISTALSDVGMISWGEIVRGLTGLGGALAIVATVSGALGKVAGFSGILGSGAILIAVQALDEISIALEKTSSLSWEEIKIGLAGLGGALAIIGTISGALGMIAGFSGLIGAGTILLAVQGLTGIADALKVFGSMSWEEIKKGLTAMGGALAEVGVVVGLLGVFGGVGGLIGAGSILLAVQGLGDVADALQKFGSMSWDEIKKGLAAMGGALGELALGGFLNSFALLGSISIANVAEPLGILADSIKKWKDVTIPDKLGLRLWVLAEGVEAFTFSGFGASAIAEVAAPLGVMASSVKKWRDVTLPENLGKNLKSLARGVRSFTFSGFGSSNIATVAEPLGVMAASIKKWKDVQVPENLGDQLSSLAKGVRAFTFAFAGGWSMEAVDKPLGKMADAVAKWKGVSIPTNLTEQLSGLADGVKTFSFAFLGGWSMSAIDGPLGTLADSVKKWKDVSIPSNLKENMESLAKGVKAFSGLQDVSSGIESVKTVASSINKLSGIKMGSVSSGLEKVASSMKKLGEAGGSISGLGSKITSNITKPVSGLSSKLKTSGANIIDSLASGIKSNKSAKTAAKEMSDSIVTSFENNKTKYKSLGTSLGTSLANGLKSKKSDIKKAITGGVKEGVDAVEGYRDDFYDAGAYIAQGMASGMNSKKKEIESAAEAMAAAAEAATRAKLKINSPSKVFDVIAQSVPEGFANGIGRLKDRIKRAAGAMADTAVYGTRNALDGLTSILDGGLDPNPTIRPVMDLSDVRSGVSAISNMLDLNAAVGMNANLGAVNAMMNRRSQNGTNADVVSAIDKLRGELDNVGGDSIVINGVTYNEGSGMSDTVRALVRAITMEGRV